MKSEIEKIMSECYEPKKSKISEYSIMALNEQKAAKKIESFSFKFAEWCANNCYTQWPKKTFGILDSALGDDLTTEQVYNYWITNVHNKSNEKIG